MRLLRSVALSVRVERRAPPQQVSLQSRNMEMDPQRSLFSLYKCGLTPVLVIQLKMNPMNSIFSWNGKLKLSVPKGLRSGHDEARAEFARAMMEGGPIAKAATRAAELCLPHFEEEEKTVFPVLALLPYLARENVRPEMMDVMPLISEFSARRDALNDHHRSILAAIEALLQAAQTEHNREFAEFAYNLRVHDRIEVEVIYPTVILIGNYLREKLAH